VAGVLVAVLGGTTTAFLATAPDPDVVAMADPSANVEDAALREAGRSGRPVLVSALTSETTEVYARPDGKFEAHLAAAPVRTLRDGQWVPIDLMLKASDDGTVAPGAHPGDLRISGAQPAGTHELASVGTGSHRVTMHWTGALTAPVLDGATATYVNALTGVDLVVKANRDGFEQSLIVKDRAAINRVRSVVLPLTGPGAGDFRRGKAGAITLSATDGTATTTIPQPSMWDAAKTPAGSPARTAPISTTVTRTDDGLALRLTPNLAWLRDPRTVFPVTLDPTISAHKSTFDTYVRQGVNSDQSGSNDLQVGLLATTPPTITRSFLTWDSTVLSGKQITAATVKFWNFWSGTCADKSWGIWPTTTAGVDTRYSSQPTWTGSAAIATSNSTTGFDASCADGWSTIDGKKFFQHFATSKTTRAYMGIRATDETDPAAFKQFRSRDGVAAEVPQASITYNSYPTLTARATVPATACVTGADRPLVNTLTPQLKATVADADHSPSVEFEWYALNGTTKIGSQKVASVATGGTATVTVPAGAFADGGRYKWRVLVSDGVEGSSSWSSYCEMTTWVTVPPVGGCEAGVAGDYNGDGAVDVAIGDPEAAVGAQAAAGTVTVAYGRTGEVQVLRQGADGVPGGPEAGDQFGFALATYDVNRDGCSDLVASTPFESIGTLAEAGSVTVLLGSPAGLGRGPAALSFDQNATGFGDDVEAGDWFGYSLAAGSTAGGEPYLAVGAPGEDLGTGIDAGLVHYRRGTSNITMWGGSGVPGSPENDDRLGYSLAGTPHHLAIGSPGEALGAVAWAGVVQTYTHEIAGTALKLVGTIGDNVSQVVDPIARDDNFGKAVAAAAYPAGGATASLLLVGSPGEDVGAATDAGKVFRFTLTATGWTQLGVVTQQTPQAGNYFGEQVRLGGNPLVAAVGVPGRDLDGMLDAGQLAVFPAAAVPAVPTELGRGSVTLPGQPAAQEVVGAYLSSSDRSLYVASPATGVVQGIPWSALATGAAPPESTWTAGTGGIAAGSAFGSAVN
jgi:hypothetical protein